MENVALPSGLQHLKFGVDFNQRMEHVALPSGLQHLSFGSRFQSLGMWLCPAALKLCTRMMKNDQMILDREGRP